MRVSKVILMSVFGALLVAAINSTKLIESDLILYQKQYLLSLQLNLIDYLLINIKDFGYYFVTYFFANFISSSFPVFIFFHSFISYLLLFIGLKNYSATLDFRQNKLIPLLTIALFMPLLFSYSAHILRQFISVSIAFFAVSIYRSDKKTSLIMFVTSILFHSSSIIFVLFYLPIKKLKYWLFLLIPLVILIGDLFISSFSQIPGFSRISSLNQGADLVPLSPFVLISIIFFGIISFIERMRTNKVHSKNIFDFIIIIHALVIVFHSIGYNEMSTRLTPLLYFYWPILLITIFSKSMIGIRITAVIISLEVVLFVKELFFGTWSYFF
jgi:hypothetical protein